MKTRGSGGRRASVRQPAAARARRAAAPGGRPRPPAASARTRSSGQRGPARLERQQAHEPRQQDAPEARRRSPGALRSRLFTVHEGLRVPALRKAAPKVRRRASAREGHALPALAPSQTIRRRSGVSTKDAPATFDFSPAAARPSSSPESRFIVQAYGGKFLCAAPVRRSSARSPSSSCSRRPAAPRPLSEILTELLHAAEPADPGQQQPRRALRARQHTPSRRPRAAEQEHQLPALELPAGIVVGRLHLHARPERWAR